MVETGIKRGMVDMAGNAGSWCWYGEGTASDRGKEKVWIVLDHRDVCDKTRSPKITSFIHTFTPQQLKEINFSTATG